jgi:ATP-dependent DNA ligase
MSTDRVRHRGPLRWQRWDGEMLATVPGSRRAASPRRTGGNVSSMRLPFAPPLEPMLAKPAETLPTEDGWLFEPKWDGFRALVFRDGDETLIQSRDLKPLDRYFPSSTRPCAPACPSGASSMAKS